MMRIVIVLFFVLVTSFTQAASLMPKDSLKTERIEGKLIVFHKVDPKETLYSLARRYKTTVASIQAMNPEESKSLEVGVVIKIPVKGTEIKVTAKKPEQEPVKKEKAKTIVKEVPKEKEAVKEPEAKVENTYTVVAGDNLFSIARKMGVGVAAIKLWNPEITNDAVKIGQVLAIKGGDIVYKTEVPAPTKKEKEKEPETTIKADNKPDLSPTGYEKVVEKGLCEVIEDKDSRLHVALSKSAPEGTVIQIKNEINGRSIFVKVIGKLPDTGANDKVIVKISYKAFEAIEANAKRFPVVVSYTK